MKSLYFTGNYEEDLNTINNSNLYCIYIKNKIKKLQENDILPIFIFDGKAPKLKFEKEGKRRENNRNNKKFKLKDAQFDNPKNKIKYVSMLLESLEITDDMIIKIKDVLNEMNVKFILAPNEADSQMAYLRNKNLIDAILTEDSDLLVYVKNINYNIRVAIMF
jgi:exonuclease-1